MENNISVVNHSNTENKELFDSLLEQLSKYISIEDIASYKENKAKGETNIEKPNFEEVDGKIIKTQVSSLEFSKEADIKNLKDLKRFLIRYKDVLKKNIKDKHPDFNFSRETELESFHSVRGHTGPGYRDISGVKIRNNRRKHDNNNVFIKDLLNIVKIKDLTLVQELYKIEVFNIFNDVQREVVERKVNSMQENNGNREGFQGSSSSLLKEIENNDILLWKDLGLELYKVFVELVIKTNNKIIDLYKENPDLIEELLKIYNSKKDLEFIEKIIELINKNTLLIKDIDFSINILETFVELAIKTNNKIIDLYKENTNLIKLLLKVYSSEETSELLKFKIIELINKNSILLKYINFKTNYIFEELNTDLLNDILVQLGDKKFELFMNNYVYLKSFVLENSEKDNFKASLNILLDVDLDNIFKYDVVRVLNGFNLVLKMYGKMPEYKILSLIKLYISNKSLFDFFYKTSIDLDKFCEFYSIDTNEKVFEQYAIGNLKKKQFIGLLESEYTTDEFYKKYVDVI